jgi:3-oxoadipate enol-lactonase
MRCLGNNVKIAPNNLTVCYNDEGPDNAPVIIFIHGFPFNKSMWDRQVEALKDNYRVLAYDIRGHGGSDEGTEDFTIDLFASDLIDFMDALEIKTALLCGLSMGGYIALNAIEKYPDRFDALILSDTQCIADSPEAKEKRAKAIESIKESGVAKYADSSIKNFFTPESFTAKREEVDAAREMINTTSKESLIKTLIALSVRNETCSKLPGIDLPVLIMVGKEDTITPPAAALFLHKEIRNSQMYVLDHSGHLANMENYFDFNNHLREFVDSVTKKYFASEMRMAIESK